MDILGWLVIALVIGIGGTTDLMLGSRRYLKKIPICSLACFIIFEDLEQYSLCVPTVEIAVCE